VRKTKTFLATLILSTMCSYSFAQKQSDLGAEALSAKVLLEDLIVRRYTQDLSTRLNRESFTLSTHLTLEPIPMADIQAEEPINDLMLGTLDPESLMKQYAGKNANDYAASLLSMYRIAKLDMTVGVRDNLTDPDLDPLKKWLTERLKNEFGSVAKGEIIQTHIPVKLTSGEEKSNLLDYIAQFQALLGHLLLALALVIGALIWGSLRKSSKELNGKQNFEIKLQTPEIPQSSNQNIANVKGDTSDPDNVSHQRDILKYQGKIKSLIEKLGPKVSDLIVLWCRQGDRGILRLACFAEATGQALGSMPIPIDAIKDVTRIFLQMPNVTYKEKHESIQQAYWDLVAMINLGPDALNQPFSYIAGLNVDAINEVLIEQNTKMKTLVTLFMPDDLRSRYI